jgi:[protein-PII] uridylyltransferase
MLVAELVARAAHVLRGAAVSGVVDDALTPEQLALLEAGPRKIVAKEDDLTLVIDDRPGVFSRIAGVLAMHGIGVVAAAVHGDDRGTGLEQFRVERSMAHHHGRTSVITDLERALDGLLDVDAEVARHEHTYERRRPQGSSRVRTAVNFDNDVSDTATVVDVFAEDGVGVLYRITKVLARHGLAVQSAKVQTMAAQVVDAFYVRDASGAKILDPVTQSAIRRDVLAALASPE